MDIRAVNSQRRPAAPLEHHFECLQALEVVLEAQRTALLEADYASIEDLTPRVVSLVNQMEREILLAGGWEVLSEDPDWPDFRARVSRAHVLNAENGRMMALAHRQVTETLALLRGAAEPRYDESGNIKDTGARRGVLGEA